MIFLGPVIIEKVRDNKEEEISYFLEALENFIEGMPFELGLEG